MRKVILHNGTTIAGSGISTSSPGIGSATGGESEHSITVVLTGTGAISATVDPQWTDMAGADDTQWASVNGARSLSGTNSVIGKYVFNGAAENVRLVTSSLTGTGVTVNAVWVGK